MQDKLAEHEPVVSGHLRVTSTVAFRMNLPFRKDENIVTRCELNSKKWALFNMMNNKGNKDPKHRRMLASQTRRMSTYEVGCVH